MQNDEIARYLAALEREDCYQADATLKESAHELTQRVFFIGVNGAQRGPYVRKLIRRESGLGIAYERIYEAQQNGMRFQHVPTIFECYRRDDFLVVVMEFVHGETLQDRVYRLDPSAKLALDVFPALCDAVTELHESFDPPLVHRDLKPSNVMLTNSGLMLIDFGIAREFKEGAETDTSHFGTRAFAPPEQFGFGQTTVRSDVYALGMMLYFCLTEQIPPQQIRDTGFSESAVPARLRPVLMRATALDPAERYASANEMKAAFLEAAAGKTTDHPADRSSGEASGNRQRPETGEQHPGDSEQRPAGDERRREAGEQHPETGGQRPAGKRQREKPRGRTRGRTIAIVLGVLIVLSAASTLSAPYAENPSGQARSTSSSQQETAAETSSNASLGTQNTATEQAAQESTLVEDMQTGAPPRNSFNPATNTPVTIAGVTFQIPECFKARTEQGGNLNPGEKALYDAESGSTLAMLVAASYRIDKKAEGEITPEMLKFVKDSILSGVYESDDDFYNKVSSSTDFALIEHSARIATLKGNTQNGLPVTTKLMYFLNTELEDDALIVGALALAQTENVQFDYSADFAKTIASAVPQ